MRRLSDAEVDGIETGVRAYGVLSYDVVLELIANLRDARATADALAVEVGHQRARATTFGAALARVAEAAREPLHRDELADLAHSAETIGGAS
jgi:hypothetical protein